MLGRLFQRPFRGDLEDFTQVSPRKQLGLRTHETAPDFARGDSRKADAGTGRSTPVSGAPQCTPRTEPHASGWPLVLGRPGRRTR